MRFILALLLCGAPSLHAGELYSNARQLTFQGKSGEGYFSPDGQRLIFQSEREPGNPFYQIYILNLDTGDTSRVSPGIGKTTCGFFRPGSDQVLFASTHLDPEARARQVAELEFRKAGKTRRYSWDYDAQMDIFSSDSAGANVRRLTDAAGYDAEGAYSPDGKLIVFSSLRNAFPLDKLSAADRKLYDTDPAYFAEIYLMNADGSNQRRLTSQSGYDGGPFFSADGQRIIWRRFEESGLIADIYSMNIDGSDARRLTDFKCMSWAPFPHPSGKYLIFTANKFGFENFELFLIGTEGGAEPVRVTQSDGFDGLPVFSPDGRKLCWTSNRTADQQSQLFLAHWDHEAALALLKSGSNSSPKPPSVSTGNPLETRLRQHVQVLASDEMLGRETGTEGTKKAAAYLAAQFEQLGLKPLGTNYLLPFEFSAGSTIQKENTSLTWLDKTYGAEDFRPLSFSANGEAAGEVVFAGYGLHMAGKLGEGYDSYAGLNLSNKVVLVLRYVPEGVEAPRRQELNRYAALRYKAMLARERGAKAILFVTGPNSPNAGELIALSNDGSASDSQIIAASVSGKFADQLLKAAGRNLKELQDGLDLENPHVEGTFALTNVTVRLSVALKRELGRDYNVAAAVPPAQGNKFIMLGAHYDHLGRGDSHSSREHSGEKGEIHNGADDNASGVAAVLELAREFAQARPADIGMIFALWSGEEKGLLGSTRFSETAPLALSNIVAYLNFDMVGRLQENKLTLQGAGSSTIWRKLIEKRNVAAGFSLVVQDDPYLPTDTTAFYPKGIPTLSFFTGSHEDYHRPTDDTEKLNWDGLARITRFAAALSADLVQGPPPDYVKVERSDRGGNRDNLRAYLGTVPDYTSEVKGVKLSGVRGGSPAEKAGLKAQDVIVEFAGQKIGNIYDYTYALDAVKIGQVVKIVVQRGEQQVTIDVTPEARK